MLRVIAMIVLTLALLATPAGAETFTVTYLAPVDPGTVAAVDGTYMFALGGNGFVQAYRHQGYWVGLGVYGETTNPLPADLPTITVSAQFPIALVIANPPAPWSVTWYNSEQDLAAAITLLPPAIQAEVKVFATTVANKPRYGLVHP